MDSESPGLAESFPTLLTFERLLFGVNISEDKNRQRINPCKMMQCYKQLPKTSHSNEALSSKEGGAVGYPVGSSRQNARSMDGEGR